MPDYIDLSEYEHAAIGCGAYKGVELDLLKETLESWKTDPGDPYILLDLRDGKTLAAFAIICKASGRDSTFEIRYACVDRDFHATAGGVRILEMIEEEAIRRQPQALLQLEISQRKLNCLGSITLEDFGYALIGHIKDFYGEGNDYFMYTKFVYRNPPEKTDKPARHEAAEPGVGLMAAVDVANEAETDSAAKPSESASTDDTIK
ncbi:MAG: hypothetical protein WBH97_02670 [Rectinemataceae bacterium]